MMASSQSYRSKKLNLCWPSKFDRWRQFGAGSHGVCPTNGLPLWSTLQLDQKLPFFEIPTGEEALSRGRAGSSLWPKRKAHDWKFLDNYGHVTRLSYDALHDPYLKRHLQKDTVKRLLQTTGQVVDGAAVSDLRQLNHYREFKRMMNLDHVHHEINREEEYEQEKRRLIQIEEHLIKYKDRRNFQQLRDHCRQQKEKREREIQEAKIRWMQKVKQKEKFLQKLKIDKQDQLQEKIRNRELKASQNQETYRELTQLKREKRLIHIGRMKRTDLRVKKYFRQKRLEMDMKKIIEMKQKWNNKKREMQNAAIESEIIRQNVALERAINVSKRKAEAEGIKRLQDDYRLQRRQQEGLEKMKTSLSKQQRELKETLIKMWKERWNIPQEKLTYLIERSLKDTFKRSSEGIDNYFAMIACKKIIEKEVNTPYPVMIAIDAALEKSIEDYTRTRLLGLLTSTQQSVTQIGREFYDKWQFGRRGDRWKERRAQATIRRAERVYKRVPESKKMALARKSFMEEYLQQERGHFQDPPLSHQGEVENSHKRVRGLTTRKQTQEKYVKKPGKNNINRISCSPDKPRSFLKATPMEDTEDEKPDNDNETGATSRPFDCFSTCEVERLFYQYTAPELVVGSNQIVPQEKKWLEVRFHKRFLKVHDEKSKRNPCTSREICFPSKEELARVSPKDETFGVFDYIPNSGSDSCMSEKENLDKTIRIIMKKIFLKAKKIVLDSVQPQHRPQIIKRLSNNTSNLKELAQLLTCFILRNEYPDDFNSRNYKNRSPIDICSIGLARQCMYKMFRIQEMKKRPDPCLSLYRIMIDSASAKPKKEVDVVKEKPRYVLI